MKPVYFRGCSLKCVPFCVSAGIYRRAAYIFRLSVCTIPSRFVTVLTKGDTAARVRVATSRYDWLRFVTMRDRFLPLFAGFFRPASVLSSPERDAYCTKEIM